MKTAPQAVKDWLAAHNVIWRADLYTLTLADGSVQRWTTCDVSLAVGGNTYLANGAVLSRSMLRQTSKLEIDTLDLRLGGTVQIGGKTLSLLAVQGWLDDARLKLDHLIMPTPGDTSLGVIPSLFEGRVSDVRPDPLVVQATVKSELEALNQLLPRFLYQAQCPHTLYDANCGLIRTPISTTVKATPAPTTTSFDATGASTQVAHGYVDFKSGANAGLRRSILSYGAAGCVIAPALPVAPAVGDAIDLTRGCDRSSTTCQGTFGNGARFRGFTHIPKPTDGG